MLDWADISSHVNPVSNTLGFKHQQPMVTEVSAFQVTEVPTNMYDYTLPTFHSFDFLHFYCFEIFTHVKFSGKKKSFLFSKYLFDELTSLVPAKACGSKVKIELLHLSHKI